MSPSLNFDIDKYINPYLPRPWLHLLPRPVSWPLGYRKEAKAPVGDILVWWWAFIGAFASILVIEAVYQTKLLAVGDHAPIVIASFGAAAILEFNTIESNLATPRACLFGQIIASVIGVAITKLFQLSPHFESLRWVAGAVSVGVASAAMGITKTIHPPAGATALLAATSADITILGWFLVPLIILGSTLMLAVALVINNVQRQFPIYWWTSADLNELKKERQESDVEKADDERKESVSTGRSSRTECATDQDLTIVIGDTQVSVPSWIDLTAEERIMLESLHLKLLEGRGRSS